MSKIRKWDFIISDGWCNCARVCSETEDSFLEDTHTSCGSNNEGYNSYYIHHPKNKAVHNCKKHPHYGGKTLPKCEDCFRAFVKMNGTYEASRLAPKLFRKLFNE